MMETAQKTPTAYRLIQLGPPRGPDLAQRNEPVRKFDDLTTHHPLSNRKAIMIGGEIVDGEQGRLLAYIGGRIEEVEARRGARTFGLLPDQILIKKDFILEDPRERPGTHASRHVAVPSPVPGVVSSVSHAEGRIDISDHGGNFLIARVRHMREIILSPGESVAYGQDLGVQSNVRTGARHVHMEIDSRYYAQFENYIADLATGRLPVDQEHRSGITPIANGEDGTYRLGESHPRIRDLQRVMANEGYRAADGGPLDQDGVYRLRMQGALLDFQHDHGVRQTGDIDPATLQFAPRARGRVPDLPDHFQPGLPMPRMADPVTAPGHPDHVDHRPGLPAQPKPRINRRDEPSATLSPLLLPLAEALRRGDERSLSDACADIAGSNRLQEILREAREQARQADAPQLSAHGHCEDVPLLVQA